MNETKVTLSGVIYDFKGETRHVELHEHHPTPPRASSAGRAGVSGVPRSRCDGQVASFARLHRQRSTNRTHASEAATGCRSRTSAPVRAILSAERTSS